MFSFKMLEAVHPIEEAKSHVMQHLIHLDKLGLISRFTQDIDMHVQLLQQQQHELKQNETSKKGHLHILSKWKVIEKSLIQGLIYSFKDPILRYD